MSGRLNTKQSGERYGMKRKPVVTAIVKVEDDTLSSSPDSAAIGKLSAQELHRKIIQTYVALGENAVTYQALVLNARERMHRGEKVGDCITWTEYADRYFRRDGESLPTCLRRLARAIEGHNPDTKHDGSKGRKKSKSSEKSELKEVTGKCQARKPDYKKCGEPADVVITCGVGEEKFCWKHFSEKNGLSELVVQKQLAQSAGLPKSEDKKIKSALDIPSKEPLPPEVEEAWRKGHEKGYDEGYRNGQDALVEYLPSVEPQGGSDGAETPEIPVEQTSAEKIAIGAPQANELEPPRPAANTKTHAIDSHRQDRETYCGKPESLVRLAAEGKEPTCGICLRTIESYKDEEHYAEFLKTVPPSTSKKQTHRLWIVYHERLRGYDLNLATMTSTPIEKNLVIGAAQANEVEPPRPAAPVEKPALVPDEWRDELEERIETINGILEKKPNDPYWTRKLKESKELLDGYDEDEERENLPAYTVTVRAKSITSMKAQLRKFGIEATVEKIVRARSRADVLDQAARQVEDAKQTVEELRDELQEWHDGMPENLQSGQKAEELETAISQLEEIISELGNVDFDNVDFPGRF